MDYYFLVYVKFYSLCSFVFVSSQCINTTIVLTCAFSATDFTIFILHCIGLTSILTEKAYLPAIPYFPSYIMAVTYCLAFSKLCLSGKLYFSCHSITFVDYVSRYITAVTYLLNYIIAAIYLPSCIIL